MRADGVPVELVCWSGTIHGFFWMAGQLSAGRELVRYAAAALRRALRPGDPDGENLTRRGDKPVELWAELGQAGFLGAHLPEADGGCGGGLADLAVIIEETAVQGCPLFMLVISPAICGSLLAAHGSPELRRAWLPGIADGSRKMAFATR